MRRRYQLLLASIGLCGALLTWAARAQEAEPSRLTPADPPNAAQITLSAPDEAGIVRINGGENSVFPNAYVAARDLYTGETVSTQSNFNGTFELDIRGVAGNPYLLVPAETAFLRELVPSDLLLGGVGTLLYAPFDDNLSQIAFAGRYGNARNADAPIWTAQAEVGSLNVEPGDSWDAAFTFILQADDVAEVGGDFVAEGELTLLPIVYERDGELVSTSSGGVGQALVYPTIGRAAVEAASIERTLLDDGVRVEFPLTLNATLPDELPRGLYVPIFRGTTVDAAGGETVWAEAPLPVVLNVGGVENAPLPFLLFGDGASGLARDGATFSTADPVQYPPPSYILPQTLWNQDALATYTLEPYVPSLWGSDPTFIQAPVIPLALADSRYQVELYQNEQWQPAISSSFGQVVVEMPNRNVQAIISRLQTGEPSLAAYSFADVGEQRLRVQGTLRDRFGNTYAGGGEYSLLVADRLNLRPTLPEGAPIILDAPIPMGLHLAPACAAEVSITVRALNDDGSATAYRGRTNDYGIMTVASGHVFREPGSYQLLYEATCRLPDGRLRAGSVRSLHVVVEATTPFTLHGERGQYDANLLAAVEQPAWFEAREYLPDGEGTLITHTSYFSGDIVVMGAGEESGVYSRLRGQDTGTGYELGLLLENRAQAVQAWRDALPLSFPAFDLLSDTASRYTAQTYLSAVRPGSVMRQFVAAGDNTSSSLAFTGDDGFNQQMGAGHEGLLPGDYGFIFGGVEGSASTNRFTGGYTSLLTVTGDETARGVYPPGYAPALVLGDIVYDAFFMPTAAQPGDVYTLGETLRVAGMVAPPLEGRVQVTITPPEGDPIAVEGRANRYGFFFNSANDVLLNQQGAWTVQVQVTVDGQTSAGALEVPLGGGIPGAPDGLFHIYVVGEDAEPLAWNGAGTEQPIPATTPYDFTFEAPEGWTNVRAYRTLTMPGYVLADGELSPTGRFYSDTYNVANLSQRFPNVEVEGRLSGAWVSDIKLLTFVVTGIDAAGAVQTQTRQFTILHDRLITTEMVAEADAQADAESAS